MKKKDIKNNSKNQKPESKEWEKPNITSKSGTELLKDKDTNETVGFCLSCRTC